MSGNSRAIISLNNLQIHASPHLPVLSSVSLDVWEGNFLALLGLPGAGKTTLVKALVGLIGITSGRGIVLNNVLNDPQFKTQTLKAQTSIGILHQSVNWPGSLTVEEILYLSTIHHAADSSSGNLDDIASVAGLQGLWHKPIQELGIKERQLVGLVNLYLQNPALLILDDPANGLKGDDRQEIFDLLTHIGRNKTIFFTTSHLSDVQYIATHVAILHDGAILAHGEKDMIFAYPDTSIYRVVMTGNTQIVYEYVNNLAWIKNISVEKDADQTIWRLAIVEQDNTPTRLLRAILADQNLNVVEFRQIRPRIDAFLGALAQVNAI